MYTAGKKHVYSSELSKTILVISEHTDEGPYDHICVKIKVDIDV
jgi:hypothetical protein